MRSERSWALASSDVMDTDLAAFLLALPAEPQEVFLRMTCDLNRRLSHHRVPIYASSVPFPVLVQPFQEPPAITIQIMNIITIIVKN